jgi:hypothetical protein
MLLSDDNPRDTDGIVMAMFFCGFIGAFLTHIAKKMKINANKFQKYTTIIFANNQTSIDNIASAIPTSYGQASKDLQQMINKGYFEGAYIDVNNRMIVLPQLKNQQSPSNLYEQTSNSTITQPKIKVVACKNCGANNNLIEGQVCECEFCGSPLG